MAHSTSSPTKKPAQRAQKAAASTDPTTPTPDAPAPPSPVTRAQSGPADSALFVREEDTVPDGTLLQPEQPFRKVWVLRNTGANTWDSGYRFTLVADSPLGASSFVAAPTTAPGAEARFTVDFKAPAQTGLQKSTWQLVNPTGQAFGARVWTEIQVAAPAAAAGGDATFPPPANQALQAPANANSTVRAVVTAWNRYGGLLAEEAQRLGIDPAVAVAVLVTESSGAGFENGRMKIRFENHIFNAYWGKQNPARFAQHFSFNPSESWKEHQWRADPGGAWLPCHQNQDNEWQVFEFARHLDERAAMVSISMGAPQIMGFNHTSIGYGTVQAMFNAFANDARSQLASLFRFMEVNGLVQAVRNGDYVSFARVYNGPGQAEHYANLIRDYMAAFKSVQTSAGRGLVQPGEPTPRSPQPVTGSAKPLQEVDPELYAAWSKHIQQGFQNNQVMFSRVLDAFLNPYWTTVWMYRVLFGVGIAAFVLAGFLAVFQANLSAAALFSGLSVAAFLSFFVSKPLQALEENLQFITWLGIIYNSYWTRLVQAQEPATFEEVVQDTTEDAIRQIKELLEKHTERSTNRPGLR